MYIILCFISLLGLRALLTYCVDFKKVLITVLTSNKQFDGISFDGEGNFLARTFKHAVQSNKILLNVCYHRPWYITTKSDCLYTSFYLRGRITYMILIDAQLILAKVYLMMRYTG